MWAVIWRLIAAACLVPFIVFPIVNFVALPLFLYLLFSLAAIAWRRHSRPSPDV